ncbi:hypothetical protein KSP39_PZI020179 [Platanthera zijinensis]|uniref:Uncharacterized protein n=1 Tax=Platanthera zijinensis TaxID=2320716 RepID=A0AAP0B0W7_9ASPA
MGDRDQQPRDQQLRDQHQRSTVRMEMGQSSSGAPVTSSEETLQTEQQQVLQQDSQARMTGSEWTVPSLPSVIDGTTEPSMKEQPRRSARLEIGQSSTGVQTAGTVSLELY